MLEERGPTRVSPHWLPNMLIDTTTSHVATTFGARGINYAIVSALRERYATRSARRPR